jgi:tetratricopeptide (TPR) repeat protein
MLLKEWKQVFDKLEEALRVDPDLEAARQNLSIAHNNKALRCNANGALYEFHQALYYDEKNLTTQCSFAALLAAMKKDASDFSVRVELGDQSCNERDYLGGVVEYRAALKLKDDAAVHRKLGDVYQRMGLDVKAKLQYEEAAKLEVDGKSK